MTDSSVAYIQAQTAIQPRIGIVLGSGLGAFTNALTNCVTLPYRDIPEFPVSTAISHAGTLILGELGGVPVAAMSGRFHLYEGYTPQQVVQGVRTLQRLGIQALVLTNAAGAVNTAYRPGDLVLLSDHINLQGANPLTGPNDEALGPRFPDLSDAYSVSFRTTAQQAAGELGLSLREGVYAALAGPNYETPAEIRYLRVIGADLVGMSTVPEVIVARHMGLPVLAISCVTNMAAGVLPQKLHHDEVMQVGHEASGRLMALLRALLPRLVF